MTIHKRIVQRACLLKASIILLLILGCSGCQITQQQLNDPHYSHYYLWIKSLSAKELLDEVNLQKQNIASGYYVAQMNLALLYALPKSPVYNPYTAKTKLNNLTMSASQIAKMSAADLGFITLMKDQLNQQILTLNKLLSSEQLSNNQQTKLQTKLAENTNLTKQLIKLKQQIKQLKKIELDINEQEQKL